MILTATFDAAATGFSGAPPSGLPFSISWTHTAVGLAGSVWVTSYNSGVDILTGSTRTCTWGGVPMLSLGVVALLGNSLTLECFVLTGQPSGAQSVVYTYGNNGSARPSVVRVDSESFTGVGAFGPLQTATGTTANATFTATCNPGEMLTVGSVARAANINGTSGVQRFIKNNVTPRCAITDQGVSAVTMTNGATDWILGAVQVIPGTAPPPPPPPPPPSVPAQYDNPLAAVMLAAGNVTPNVSAGTMSSTPSAYTNPVQFNWDSGQFRIGGTLVLSDHNNYQCGVNSASGQSTETNPLTDGLTSFETEFWLMSGASVEIVFRNFASSDYLIVIDDLPLTAGWANFPQTAGYQYFPLTFSDSVIHRIRVLHGGNGFVGVRLPQGGAIAPAGPRTQIAVIGDSYVQGIPTSMAGGMCGALSVLLGAEVINLGQGTTGYVTDGVGGNRTHYGSDARLACLNAWTPDTIIVFGGGNDSSADPNVVAAAAEAMWAAINAAQPNAKLIVVGIQSPNLYPAAEMTALNTAIAVAAQPNPCVDAWIDMRDPEFWVSAETQSMFIDPSTPAIHPNHAGAVNIATRIAFALAQSQLHT